MARILIVDDDRSIRRTLEKLLVGDGFDVSAAGDAPSAIVGATSDIDLVLLDLKMPKVDGHEVLRQIRADAELRELKVVVLTSSDQERDRQMSRQLGSDGYLVKPASIAGLIGELRRASHLLFPADPSSAG